MKKKSNNFLYFSLAIVVLVLLGLFSQGFSIVPQGEDIYIPIKGSAECTETRLAYFPSNHYLTDDLHTIDRAGESFWCGEKTFGSDSEFLKGCDFYLSNEGSFFLIQYIQVCDADGSNCITKDYKENQEIHINENQKIYINPSLGDVFIYGEASVYGLRIDTPSVLVETDRCDFVSAMNKGQIALLKNDSNYVNYIVKNSIPPDVYNIQWIVGYSPISSNNILEKSGDSWFVPQAGQRCLIELDTNNKYILTDDCVADNEIQCTPNIPNYCDSEGKLIISDEQEVSCIPNQILSSKPILTLADEVCLVRCNSEGVAENYDCKEIPVCEEGEMLNSDYDCVSSTQITEEDKCEANEGKWTKEYEDDVVIREYCDYSSTDVSWLIAGLIALAIILLMLVIKQKMKGGRK